MSSEQSLNLPSLCIATRGSKLALQQTEIVTNILKKNNYLSKILIIKTVGDRIQDRPLYELGGKGVFIKELESKLLKQEADIAVHSLKDMQAQLPDKLEIAAYLEREVANDILITKKDSLSFHLNKNEVLSVQKFSNLPALKIATSSLRRKELIRRAGEQFNILTIRGNIDTRIKKLQSGYCDAIILAKAGVKRLNINTDNVDIYDFDVNWFTPCAGQGVIALEMLKDSSYKNLVASFSCLNTELHACIERGILTGLGASCMLPLGIYSRFDKAQENIVSTVTLMSPNLEKMLSETLIHPYDSPVDLVVNDHLLRLKKLGADEILASLQLPEIVI